MCDAHPVGAASVVKQGVQVPASWRKTASEVQRLLNLYLYFFLIYLFMREAETQAEGEAASMQGAQRGTGPGTPGSRPGLKVLNH